jgi:hypothetical protein
VTSPRPTPRPAPDTTRRWEDDERGTGVADARASLARLDALRAHADRDGWVAEQPEGHLWPHLEAAIAEPGSPWRNASWSIDPEGRLVVEVEHHASAEDRPMATLRADAFTLVGQVAESSTYVRVARPPEAVELANGARADIEVEVVTGMLDDETPFASHGHTLALRIVRVDPHATAEPD